MWLTSGLTSRVCVYCSGLSCSWPIVKSQQILPEVLESHCSRSQPLKDTTKMTKENLTGSQFFLEYGYENRKFSLSSTLSNSIGINTLLVSSDYTIMTIETSFFFILRGNWMQHMSIGCLGSSTQALLCSVYRYSGR